MSLNSQLVQEYFSDFMAEFVEPTDVFVAFKVDQGGNVASRVKRWTWRP